jgi:cell shape-determining protein MreC
MTWVWKVLYTTPEKGFGDEQNPIEESQDVMQENERLKKELSELKAMLGKK